MNPAHGVHDNAPTQANHLTTHATKLYVPIYESCNAGILLYLYKERCKGVTSVVLEDILRLVQAADLVRIGTDVTKTAKGMYGSYSRVLHNCRKQMGDKDKAPLVEYPKVNKRKHIALTGRGQDVAWAMYKKHQLNLDGRGWQWLSPADITASFPAVPQPVPGNQRRARTAQGSDAGNPLGAVVLPQPPRGQQHQPAASVGSGASQQAQGHRRRARTAPAADHGNPAGAVVPPAAPARQRRHVEAAIGPGSTAAAHASENPAGQSMQAAAPNLPTAGRARASAVVEMLHRAEPGTGDSGLLSSRVAASMFAATAGTARRAGSAATATPLAPLGAAPASPHILNPGAAGLSSLTSIPLSLGALVDGRATASMHQDGSTHSARLGAVPSSQPGGTVGAAPVPHPSPRTPRKRSAQAVFIDLAVEDAALAMTMAPAVRTHAAPTAPAVQTAQANKRHCAAHGGDAIVIDMTDAD